ncbi:MAG: ABC transporter permease [Candidatus Schekmanbacteria bacterium]|nr:ABC transporter permease [Candidatus Schekmanbacteria bacterium]
MVLAETVRVATGAIGANKLRSFLTMLGIIIGIAAVIAMVALGEGAQGAVQERLRNLGTAVFSVRPGQQFFGGVDRGAAGLTIHDAEAIASGARFVLGAAPEAEQRLQTELGEHNANLSVIGTWPSYFEINNHALAAGRLLTESDERARRRAAVAGATAPEQLGVRPAAAIVGQKVRIKGVTFEVVGILAAKGSQGFQSPDDALYIPLSTAQLRVFGSDRVRSISVRAAGESAVDSAIVEVERVLRRQHRLHVGEENDFNVRNQAALLTTFQETTRTFSFLLAGIAAVSLLVGGIGIMNIMLVSVTERTREIGVRKALGARRRDILLQFLVEALVLCLAGGAIGIAVGVGGAELLRRMAGWQTAVQAKAVLVAFGFSAAVGIAFGLWPARRAAKLDPIEALRYE